MGNDTKAGVTVGSLVKGAIRDVADIFLKDRALFIASNVFIFGLFALGVVVGFAYPAAHDAAGNLFEGTLTSGPLTPVTQTLETGNIPLTALSIFAWNYLVATIVLSSIPSLIFPPWMPLKFGLSAFMMGLFAAHDYTPAHLSIMLGTLLLEFEGYAIAIFATMRQVEALVWPGRFGEKSVILAYVRSIIDNVKLLIVAGIVLAIAATFEAAAIILVSTR